jgi:hypothetical protein
MGQMSSNSKNESLIGSEELRATDKTASFDATGEEVGFFEGQGIQITILLASDLTKKKITSAHFSKDKGGPALGFRQIGIREWNDDYITY